MIDFQDNYGFGNIFVHCWNYLRCELLSTDVEIVEKTVEYQQ